MEKLVDVIFSIWLAVRQLTPLIVLVALLIFAWRGIQQMKGKGEFEQKAGFWLSLVSGLLFLVLLGYYLFTWFF